MQEKQSKSPNFIPDLEAAFSSLNEHQTKTIKLLLGDSNDRQKLKTIKKVLQTPADSEIKSIFHRVIQEPILNQYIYGRLQAKPVVLNIFKVLPVSDQLLIAQTDKLTTFEHIKLLIEVIQMLSISNKITKESKQILKTSKLFHKIYTFLIAEFVKGTQSIAKNQFRSKWLQYFLQVLRCLNYILKFLGQNIPQYKQNQTTVYKLAEKCAQYSHLLNKQVITQLYIILITLNKGLNLPESSLQQIHYLHACTIVKGQNTLKPLLKLASQLKDTQQKSQLAPILLKSFLDYFQQGKKQNIKLQLDEELKLNAFDCAISLFQVGRSIYSYLEDIIDIIITNGGNWSLEGNFTRKFFITTVALKHVSTETIFNLWPTCLENCFVESGNMTMAYVTDCAEALLSKLYLELDKDYQKWMNIWIQLYKKLLASENRAYIRGITDFINPILLKINSSNSLLLKQVSSLPQNNLSTQLGIISLIKCYKEIGKIQSKYNIYLENKKIAEEEAKRKEKQAKKQKKQDSKTQISQTNKKTERKQMNEQVDLIQKEIVFVHLDDKSFQFGYQFLLSLLLSNDSTTSLQTLEFLVTSRKPSNLILPQEMKLILEFYKNCLKTSMPEYRKSYLNLTRRILERFRKNYEKDLTKQKTQPKNKKPKIKTQFFQQFVQFLNSLIQQCFINIYPDSIFEITNPALQILLLILNLFGPRGCQIRKGTYIDPSQLLVERSSFFKIENFQNLVICLQSSYESIRCIAYEILRSFNNFDEIAIKNLRKLWEQSVFNTNKLSIRSYEFACRMLVFIGGLKQNQKNIVQIPQKYSLNQLNICQFLLETLRKRYQIFKEQFVDQGDIYYKNLIHGVLTCFSYILDQVSKITSFSEKNIQDLNNFLTQFFGEIVKILNFSVDISSANVSTVVLDTLANASQTDKKLTVDCRGHFLPDKKSQTGNTIGSYLDSTALITSMENQQQGIENTLVVSFYLLTRQAGLVFQSIGSLMGNTILGRNIPRKPLIQLVNTYFYALINLKHMGSVDRISNGLSKMTWVILDQQDPDLMKIPQQLLDQLLNLLGDGKFTNILRRSAGIPYAFSCLLKSQAIKRKLLIQKTIKMLLNQSKQQSNSSIELRIHSLNILKKLFQDSDLKQDLDIYVSQAFMCAIRGFTSQEWGVRNSSLMLFSVLANRTLGIRPTYNLLEFFHKCPELFNFISKELEELNPSTMYPPLYPIVLLLSRLLPFDLRERARNVNKKNTTKQLRKQQLLTLEPLLRRAGNNHNYMGRVMTAKAILPFMYLSNIVPHCLQLLQQHVSNIHSKTINNNNQHFRLTECYQLLRSYHEILATTQSNVHNPTLTKQAKDKAYEILFKNSCFLDRESLQDQVSPTVHEIYFRIFNDLVQNYFPITPSQTPQQTQNLQTLSLKIYQNASKTLKKLITLKPNQIGDLGYSLMYKSCIELIYTSSKNLIGLENYEDVGLIFMEYLFCQRSMRFDQETDYQVFCLVLEKVVGLLEIGREVKSCKKLYDQLSKWLSLIKVSEIQSDETIIKILSIYISGTIRINEQNILEFINLLQKIQKKSQNKHMKVAIFQFLLTHLQSNTQTQQTQTIKKQSTQFLQSLLNSYSNPNQLDDLRECCVLYLQKTTQLKASLIIVYLRLLDDQEYQIRKRSAGEISRILGIRPCNQLVVVREILWRFVKGQSYIQRLNTNNNNCSQQSKKLQMNQEQQAKFIISLLQQNSDYQIRMKNHSEQRIFSYDKPNKYRTDINILYQTISLIQLPVIHKLQSLQTTTTTTTPTPKTENLISYYQNQIMQRNQYQFETILRMMLVCFGRGQGMEVFRNVALLQPILWEVYRKFMMKK